MASLAMITALLIVISSSSSLTCKSNSTSFLECISNHSSGGNIKLLQNIHSPNSPAYISLLQEATQNPRWFDSTTERPLLIISPSEEAEIKPIITCSKMVNRQIRVCSGGHDYEGLSFRSKTPFIMLSLANLNRTIVSVQEESAWIQSGVSLGQLYHEISRKSRVHAFPGGLYPTVGSGGHISGGGLGTLVRKYGLAADNVLDARVMDSNGSIMDRATMGEELFWAIRGGNGASFCIILAWKLRLVRVPEKVTAFAFRRVLDPENLCLLQKWQSEAHSFSNDLFMRVLVQNKRKDGSSDGEKFVQVTYNGLFLGPADEFVSGLNKSFPEFGLEVEDCFEPIPVNNSCSDKPCVKKECYQVPWIRSVLYFYGKKTNQPLEILLERESNLITYYKATSDFLKGPIPDTGWEMIRDMFMLEDQPFMIIDPLGGKMDEIAEDETPFPHRKGNLYVIQYMTKWEANDRDEADKHLRWIRKLYDEMKRYVADSPRTAYLNYRDLDLGVNDQSYSYDRAKVWGEKYFKQNFERLAKVKGMIDPGNFFRFEQSIPVPVLLQ